MSLATPNLTEFHHAVADAHGISLYDHYSERDAAKVLGLSLVALRRLRTGQRISMLRLSPRKIAFFGYQLVEFLLSSVESIECPDTIKNETSNSEITGFPSSPAATPGVAPGSTRKPDRLSVYHSALRTLQKPDKS